MLPERTTTIGAGESVYSASDFHSENAVQTIKAKLASAGEGERKQT